MGIVVAVVIVAFCLLYLAVVAEERHMNDATKTRKR
jgi:hypothetical protein